jgi:hypothetical protein
MKKLLALLLAVCFSMTDTISVYLFFYSNMHQVFAILALCFLFVNVLFRQYKFFKRFVDEQSMSTFISMPYSSWAMNLLLLVVCGFLAYFPLAAQLYSLLLFFQHHQLTVFYFPSMMTFIVSISAVANILKIRSDIMTSWHACQKYYESLLKDALNHPAANLYLLLRGVTFVTGCYLTLFSYELAFNSMMYLLAHSSHFSFVAAAVFPSYALRLLVSLPLILISAKIFVQYLLRMDRAICSLLKTNKFSNTNISYVNVSKLLITCGIKTVAAARVSNMATSVVFSANLVSELDDLNFPEVDNESPSKTNKQVH